MAHPRWDVTFWFTNASSGDLVFELQRGASGPTVGRLSVPLSQIGRGPTVAARPIQSINGPNVLGTLRFTVAFLDRQAVTLNPFSSRTFGKTSTLRASRFEYVRAQGEDPIVYVKSARESAVQFYSKAMLNWATGNGRHGQGASGEHRALFENHEFVRDVLEKQPQSTVVDRQSQIAHLDAEIGEIRSKLSDIYRRVHSGKRAVGAKETPRHNF
jgi:hypothetical protein